MWRHGPSIWCTNWVVDKDKLFQPFQIEKQHSKELASADASIATPNCTWTFTVLAVAAVQAATEGTATASVPAAAAAAAAKAQCVLTLLIPLKLCCKNVDICSTFGSTGLLVHSDDTVFIFQLVRTWKTWRDGENQ